MNRFQKLIVCVWAVGTTVVLSAAGVSAQSELNGLIKPMPHTVPYPSSDAPLVSDKGTPKWCTDDAWRAAEPLKQQLQNVIDQVERSRDGGYPSSISLPSVRGARVNYLYRKTGPSYTIAIGSIHDTSIQYVGALRDFMACSTLYTGTAKEITALGLYVPDQVPHTPFLYYAPHLGLYYLSDRPDERSVEHH